MTSKKIKWVRLLSAILAVMMTLGFTGCGGSGADESSESGDISDPNGEKAEPHKVGYIFRESVSEGGFAAQMCEQRERASNRSSMDTCYIENVTISDFEGAVKALADAGCTDIVACSPTYANIASSVSKKYLDLNFICFGSLNSTMNCSAYSEAPYQGAYVAGLAANFNSKAKKIGVVTDPGLPDAVAVINAVELGSQLNQDGGSLVFAAGAEENGEIKKAIDALLERGCDVIVCYTNSPYSADYCQEKGVKFIGCLDYDENFNEYSNMLMYFYCRRDNYFLAQFKSMVMDTRDTIPYMGDMSNGIVNVSAALEAAANGTQHIIDALVPYLTAGAAQVFKGPLKDTEGNLKYLETDVMSDRDIANMSWYVQGVTTIGDFREMNINIPENDFVIKT